MSKYLGPPPHTWDITKEGAHSTTVHHIAAILREAKLCRAKLWRQQIGRKDYEMRSLAGGLVPDVSCSDYPHAGAPSADNDSCLATAASLLSERHDVIPSPTLFASTPGASTDGGDN